MGAGAESLLSRLESLDPLQPVLSYKPAADLALAESNPSLAKEHHHAARLTACGIIFLTFYE